MFCPLLSSAAGKRGVIFIADAKIMGLLTARVDGFVMPFFRIFENLLIDSISFSQLLVLDTNHTGFANIPSSPQTHQDTWPDARG